MNKLANLIFGHLILSSLLNTIHTLVATTHAAARRAFAFVPRGVKVADVHDCHPVVKIVLGRIVEMSIGCKATTL
jgi:hypothetical protein